MQIEFVTGNKPKKKFTKLFLLTFDSQREIDYFVAQMSMYYAFTNEKPLDETIYQVHNGVNQLISSGINEKRVLEYGNILDNMFKIWLYEEVSKFIKENGQLTVNKPKTSKKGK